MRGRPFERFTGRLAVALTAVLLLCAQASAPPEFEAGLQAYEKGDYNAAYRLLAKSAQKRHPASVYYRALILWEGKVGRLNDPTAASWFRFAAAKGHVDAQYMLGRVLLSGRGFKRDPARAREWLTKAAKAGHRRAHFQLNVLNFADSDTPGPRFAILEEAAEKGIEDAYFLVAQAYEQGRGTDVDPGEAARWYTKASAAGDPRAKLATARLLASGDVPGGDAAAGLAVLIEGAQAGDKLAMMALGDAFIAGGSALAKSVPIGLAWYERAAELGYDPAVLQLATWFTDGTHVAKDLDRAADWLRASAQAGNANSAFRLGKLYDNATGGTQAHKAAALEWYWRAARKGHGEAMRWLAYLLRGGSAGVTDRVDAYYWFARAGAAGQPTKTDIANTASSMSPEELAEAKRKLARAKAKGLMK